MSVSPRSYKDYKATTSIKITEIRNAESGMYIIIIGVNSVKV